MCLFEMESIIHITIKCISSSLRHPFYIQLLHHHVAAGEPMVKVKEVSRLRSERSSLHGLKTVFGAVGNVYVVPKANMVTYTGPTMVSNTLHACAILLKKFKV
ncbi:putative glycosyl transferase, family 14 [Helianthus anomalus]